MARYLLASRHDDHAGAVHTYCFLGSRGSFGQVAGSTVVLISAINATLSGLLVSVVLGGRVFSSMWRSYQSEFPSPT